MSPHFHTRTQRQMRDDFVVDLWSRIKHFVPAKDRLDVADAIVAVCDEYGYADGIEHHADLDKELYAAVQTYYGDPEEEEDDEYEY